MVLRVGVKAGTTEVLLSAFFPEKALAAEPCSCCLLSVPASPPSPLHVLLVEDEALIRRLLTMALAMTHPEAVILEAENASEARVQWAKMTPSLAVVDLHLGDDLGMELLGEWKAASPDVPLVALTGKPSAGLVREALGAEIDGFLTKGEPFEMVETALREVLAGRRYYSPVALECLVASRAGGSEALSSLTPREREILLFMARGISVKETASQLTLSPDTVKVHRHRVLRKLELRDAVAATHFALAHGLITARG
jgi:DNA-binding NarL/FixJ family response regulator